MRIVGFVCKQLRLRIGVPFDFHLPNARDPPGVIALHGITFCDPPNVRSIKTPSSEAPLMLMETSNRVHSAMAPLQPVSHATSSGANAFERSYAHVRKGCSGFSAVLHATNCALHAAIYGWLACLLSFVSALPEVDRERGGRTDLLSLFCARNR